MRNVNGIVQQILALFDPPTTAITIATDDAELIVAIAAGDLAVRLRGLRCGTPITAEIDDAHEPHMLIGYSISELREA